jgi:Mg2+ and Co2+ transporter CorA
VTVLAHDGAVTVSSVERTGVLVIRAWVETNSADRLRARIMRAYDFDRPEQSILAASAEEITAAVAEWVAELLDGGPGDETLTAP